ncbi:hypothetical protein [Microbacterium sp. MYb64]|uniref:hypothetical protein n=1 Tax=Microbacterium sp. MYb64 TaxID=1848691 RepID=UPI0015E3A419|nr:hypothetical protein [Microbacterium sp. MYb64]
MIDGTAAAQWLLNYGSVRPSMCLYYVWQAYKAQGASTSMGAQTAYAAWEQSDGKRPGDRNPPAGAAVWWGRRTWDGNLDGDVVISLGDGRVAVTEAPGQGAVTGSCTLDERENEISREYLGWTSSIFDCPINVAAGKDAASITPHIDLSKEDDMSMNTIRRPDGTIYFADELGPDHLGDYKTADIDLGEFIGSAQGVWGAPIQLNDRQFDITVAIAQRRWDRKRKQIVDDLKAALLPEILKALDPKA